MLKAMSDRSVPLENHYRGNSLNDVGKSTLPGRDLVD